MSPEPNTGGDGGDGRSNGRTAPGGFGAAGTVDYGGGGGGGAARGSNGAASPGGDAKGHAGGWSKLSPGGQGGVKPLYSNGGLLYLSGKEILGSGIIDVSGTVGENGVTGGQFANRYHREGGSGGGGPGGEGGVVILDTDSLSFGLKFDVSGGRGGQPGGGVRPGKIGEDGISGFVD